MPAEVGTELPPPASPEDRRRVLGARAAIALGGCLVVTLMAWRAFYSSDDLLNFSIARGMGLTWSYLQRDIFGHWAPAHRLADWALGKWTPLDWVPALLATVCFVALGVVFLDRLLLALRTTDELRWLLLVVFCISPLVMSPLVWYAAGILVIPGTACVLACLDGFVRHRQTRRWGPYIECVLGFSVGLLFYEIPLLLIGILALLSIALLDERLTIRRAVRDVVSHWRIWVAIVPIGLVYFWNYQTNVAYRLPHPSLGTLAEFMRVAWFDSMVPATFGIEIHRWPSLSTAIVVVAQVAFVAMVVVGISRRPRVWRLWAIAAAVFTANSVLIGWNRAALFGPGLADDLRYHTIVLPFLLIAIAASFSSTSPYPLRVPATSREETSTRQHGRGRGRAALATAAAVFVALAVVSGQWLTDHSQGMPVKPYVENLRAGIDTLRTHHDAVTFFDGGVPFQVVPSAYAPFNAVSEVVAALHERDFVSFSPTAAPGYLVDEEGRVRPASFEAVTTTTISGGVGTPPCATPGTPNDTITVQLDPVLAAGDWTAWFRFAPGAASDLRVLLDTGQGQLDITGGKAPIHLPAGTRRYLVPLRGVPVASLHLQAVGGGPLCLSGATVGHPVTRS